MKRTLSEQPDQLQTIVELDRDMRLYRFLERCKQLAEYDRLLTDRARIHEFELRDQCIGRCENALNIFRDKIKTSSVTKMANMVPVFDALQAELDAVRNSLKEDSYKLYNRYLPSMNIGASSVSFNPSDPNGPVKKRYIDTSFDWKSIEYVPVAEVSPTESERTGASPDELTGASPDELIGASPDELTGASRQMITTYNHYVLATEEFRTTCSEPCWDRMFDIITVYIGRLRLKTFIDKK